VYVMQTFIIREFR